MNLKKKKWIRFRAYLISLIFLIGLGTLVARAYQLQVLERDRLNAIARDGYICTIKLPSKRGTIYDRRGHELAISAEAGSVYSHPGLVKEKRETARKLSRALNKNQGKILTLLRRKKSFVWIDRKIAPERASAVKALDLPGVGVTKETRRYYPGREIAAHLVGFVGTDNNGLEGLEKEYDKFLQGPQLTLIHMKDALGRPFSITGLNNGASPFKLSPLIPMVSPRKPPSSAVVRNTCFSPARVILPSLVLRTSRFPTRTIL